MQPDLPNLPPMPSSPNVAQAAPENMMAQRQPAPIAPGGRRLRQILTIVTGGSLGVMALVGVAQLTFRPGLRPTDVAAIFEAQTDLGTMNQKLGVEPGKVAFTEDEYREKIAEAERRGQASAELQFQKKLMVVQADKERVVGAYQTLYQRTNIIAQAGVQMEAQALQFRQRLIEQTNGGRAMVINIYDAGCALGSEEACAAARKARAGMIEESTGLTEGDLARKVRQLMAGIPDPASLVVRRDTADNGPPAIDR